MNDLTPIPSRVHSSSPNRDQPSSPRTLTTDRLAQVKLYEVELAAQSPGGRCPTKYVMTW